MKGWWWSTLERACSTPASLLDFEAHMAGLVTHEERGQAVRLWRSVVVVVVQYPPPRRDPSFESSILGTCGRLLVWPPVVKDASNSVVARDMDPQCYLGSRWSGAARGSGISTMCAACAWRWSRCGPLTSWRRGRRWSTSTCSCTRARRSRSKRGWTWRGQARRGGRSRSSLIMNPGSSCPRRTCRRRQVQARRPRHRPRRVAEAVRPHSIAKGKAEAARPAVTMPASVNGKALTAVMRDGKRLCPGFQLQTCRDVATCGFAHLRVPSPDRTRLWRPARCNGVQGTG